MMMGLNGKYFIFNLLIEIFVIYDKKRLPKLGA